MQLAQLQAALWNRLDDDGTYYPASQVTNALNEGQRFFQLLTQCLEQTVTWTPIGGPIYHMLSLYPDWLCIHSVAVNGTPLRPATLAELDALDANWLSASGGTPQRYVTLGFDVLLFYPASLVPVTLNYHCSPPPLVGATDVPAIPEKYDDALLDYGEYCCRQGEGGQEFLKVLGRFSDFLTEALRAAEFYKGRVLDSRYEKKPIELSDADKSRLLKFRPTVGKGG